MRSIDGRFGRVFHDAVKRTEWIHFSLDGLPDVRDAIRRGAAGFITPTRFAPGNMTNAELRYLVNQPKLLLKTTFYRSNKVGIFEEVGLYE